MCTVNSVKIAGSLMLLAALTAQPVFAQGYATNSAPVDLTGTWNWFTHEDFDRNGGPDPAQYWGLPINDAARMRADTYREDWIQLSPIMQCRPRGPEIQPHALDPMRIEQVVDPLTNELVAYRVFFEKLPGARMIWLDDREPLSQYAQHSWEGFSTGKFKGDTLEITTTHLKEGHITRNGVPTSFRATVIEQVFLDEPYLHWVFTVIDPDYLTESLVRSGTYIRAPNLQIPPYPCQPEDNRQYFADHPSFKGNETYFVPHYLPGENPFFTEAATKYGAPLEAMRGGAETLYPKWREVGINLSPPTAGDTFRPVYNDASTRIAERADAQPKSPPGYDNVEALHVAGDVYLIAGAGRNIAASAGGDGVFMVDSGAAAASDKVLAAIRQIAQRPRPEERPRSASPFASTWQGTHAFAGPRIRMIINTNDHPERVGGNANIRKSPLFRVLGYRHPSLSLQILAHEQTQHRIIEANNPNILAPTDAYFSEKHTVYRFLNNEAVQLFHMPNAITDGDSVVWFRHSDVIVTGDIYNSETYPPIELDKGGGENFERGGTLKVATTHLKPGYYWKSGAPYSARAVLTEHFRIMELPDRNKWLLLSQRVEDPEYLRTPFVVTYHFKKLPDGSQWNPTPCSVR